MSLPVVNINISYEDEKGAFLSPSYSTGDLNFSIPEKIRDFLSKFKSQEKDLASDFANIDIDSRDDSATSELATLKYMNQLVRVHPVFSSFLTASYHSNESPTVINRCWSLTWKIFIPYASLLRVLPPFLTCQ